MIELLAPSGDFSKLKTAFYFGADAAYVGGKNFSLRAQAGNFDEQGLSSAANYAHSLGKKLYVAANIFARNYDLGEAADYFRFISEIGIDGAIISDAGMLALAKRVAPTLNLNLSTQANTLNKEAVRFWADNGVKRVILARELSLAEISEIHAAVPDVELEAFVHGAMCISYSGRCLLSDYFTGRDGNRGECVQACRWEYELTEKGRGGVTEIQEDSRGTYILNSKDLNLIDRISELAECGVTSFKIEGRMKSEYYIATVVNAYRRALDGFYRQGAEYKNNPMYRTELEKTAHRAFTEAYFSGSNSNTVNYADSQSKGTRRFVATVLDCDREKGYALIEMRNRFRRGDVLEVLSPNAAFNSEITVERLEDESGAAIDDAKLVQQKLKLYTDVLLNAGDILRIADKE